MKNTKIKDKEKHWKARPNYCDRCTVSIMNCGSSVSEAEQQKGSSGPRDDRILHLDRKAAKSPLNKSLADQLLLETTLAKNLLEFRLGKLRGPTQIYKCIYLHVRTKRPKYGIAFIFPLWDKSKLLLCWKHVTSHHQWTNPPPCYRLSHSKALQSSDKNKEIERINN